MFPIRTPRGSPFGCSNVRTSGAAKKVCRAAVCGWETLKGCLEGCSWGTPGGNARSSYMISDVQNFVTKYSGATQSAGDA